MSNDYSDELLITLIRAINVNTKATLDKEYGFFSDLFRYPERKKHKKEVEEIELTINKFINAINKK